MIGGVGNNYVDGGTGFDFVRYKTAHNVIVDLIGGTGTSAIANDKLFSIERVQTGVGDDVVYGDIGMNVIWLVNGDDWASGYHGNDTIKGHDGDDRLFDEFGSDNLWGGKDADKLWGGKGIDVLRGGAGNDMFFGRSSHDLLKDKQGNDTLDGGKGNDELLGGSGNDTIDGGDGDDVIDTGVHDDLIYITNGMDIITTGSGSGTLFFQSSQTSLDVVTDFDVNADYFAFDPDVFADDASIDLYNLAADNDAHAHATLYVREDHITWRPLIHVYDVDANDINQRIQNGAITHPRPEVEGDFQFEKEVPVAPEFGDFFLM